VMRDARVCRAGSSSAGGVSVRRHVGWEQCPFATFCDFCGHPLGIEAKGFHAKPRGWVNGVRSVHLTIESVLGAIARAHDRLG
jgi:hypothetical protein